jgi:hypothetical protein
MSNKTLAPVALNSTAVTTTVDNIQQRVLIKTKSSDKAIAMRRQVVMGLVKPTDEKLLTGELNDKDFIVPKVIYTFDGIKGTAEAWMDENNNIGFSSENASLATKDAIVKIIAIVCNHIECVKSTLTIHLHAARGYIKSKEAKVDMTFGEEIEPLHISHLYAVDDKPQAEQNVEPQDNTPLELGDGQEEKKKKDL